jgi:hypothetical protein
MATSRWSAARRKDADAALIGKDLAKKRGSRQGWPVSHFGRST